MPTTCRAACLAALLAASAALPAAAQDRGRVERGRDLLVQYRCGSCHAIPGVPGSRGQVAQSLKAWRHRSYIAGRLPNRPDVLARWIEAPASLVPGTLMPRMGASADEAQAMAAYLFTLE
ncbi:MAG TPA: c-type cytochrome [Ramlibacter sp.]|uniref:c-type cytochrome n=1 Tax=Ramlibacter sp. TaxID=1917967 RepID=UPI002ED20EE1